MVINAITSMPAHPPPKKATTTHHIETIWSPPFPLVSPLPELRAGNPARSAR
jgi:hypothetical protein